MPSVPPLADLADDPAEWHRLHLQIRAAQRERRGRWDLVIHPFEVIYATAFLTLRWIVGTAFGIMWAFALLLLRLLVIVTFPVWFPVILASTAVMKRKQVKR